MNLTVLQRSRRKPEAGDVFAYQIRGKRFGFGRVICTDARMESAHDLILVYFYNAFSDTVDAIPTLNKRDLILAPTVLVNNGAWTRGYFRTIENRPLRKADVLRVHCFHSPPGPEYFDEHGNRLKRKSQPCGLRAFSNHITVDVRLSMACGVAPDPETLPQPNSRKKR